MNREREDLGSSPLQLSDLQVTIHVPQLRLDLDSGDGLSKNVRELIVDVNSSDGVPLGHVECFLFDAVSADRDEETLFDEADSDSESCEFYEFLFSDLEFIRGRLLHRVLPSAFTDDDDDDENWELCNVLCVNGGWWLLRPEALTHLISRLQRTLNFSFACVDTAYLRTIRCDEWREAPKPLRLLELPSPFKQVVWSETVPSGRLTEGNEERFFWIAALFENAEEIDEMSDNEGVQIGAVR